MYRWKVARIAQRVFERNGQRGVSGLAIPFNRSQRKSAKSVLSQPNPIRIHLVYDRVEYKTATLWCGGSTIKVIDHLRRRDWESLQSAWVLPTARRFYLIGAVSAIVVALLSVALAIVFQLFTYASLPETLVPDVPPVEVKAVDPQTLDALFVGPQEVRIIGVAVQRPVVEGQVVGRFAATTPYDMAAFPAGFEIVGGASAGLLKEDSDPQNVNSGTVLRATKQLADKLNAMSSARVSSPSAELRIVAQDANGNQAPPASVRFNIPFAPKYVSPGVVPTDDVRAGAVEDVSAPPDLQPVVAALARLFGRPGTPEYNDAYEFANGEPARCEAKGNPNFSNAYVRAFSHIRSKLTKENVGTFYRGLCAAWSQKLLESRSESARMEAAREKIVSANALIQVEIAARNATARTIRNTALGVALACVFFFMVVALFLAFLAIEGHSNAIRGAIQMLAEGRAREAEGRARESD